MYINKIMILSVKEDSIVINNAAFNFIKDIDNLDLNKCDIKQINNTFTIKGGVSYLQK